MKSDWKTIFMAWGGAAVLPLVLGYLFREWISVRLKKSIQHEYDTKLEGFKAGYQKILDENQIRFSRFYSEQADTIKELYIRLSKLKIELSNLTTAFKTVSEDEKEQYENEKKLHQKVIDTYNPCSEYFLNHKIFLSEQLCSKIALFIETARDSYIEYHVAGYEINKHSSELKREARKKVCEDLEEILTELQTMFRVILNGDDTKEVEK